MEKAVIIDVGVEGGGATVYGRREDGAWVFWHEGSAMGDDPGDWRAWSAGPTADLFALLPSAWYRWHPVEVHPEFKALIRAEFERRMAAHADEMSEEEREHCGEVWERRLS